MIVDDVKKHHQAVTVRGIDERAQIVGAAVAALGRERQSADLTPVAAAGKFRDRQLDGSDTERGEGGSSRATPAKPPTRPASLESAASCHGRPRQSG